MSKFKKRHYEALAEVIQEARQYLGSPAMRLGVDEVVDALCSALKADNPQFKRDRFEAACVPGANVKARS